MNLVKIIVIASASALFVISCGQSASTPNVTNASKNAVVVAAATPATPAVRMANNDPAIKKRLSAAAAVDEEVAMAPEEGQTPDLYSEKCMICHKDTGKGGKVTIEGKTLDPIDLTATKIKTRSDDKLLAQIKQGVPDEGMPAFKEKLTDDQIRSIIQHIRQLQAN